MSEQNFISGDHDPDKEVNLGLIITPMLDVAFQLMAFFILTYHPKALEGHINGKLLPPEQIAIQSAMPKVPDEKPEDMSAPELDPEVQDAVMVIVMAVDPGQEEGEKTEGQPSRILVKTPEAPEPETIADSTDSIDEGFEKLLQRLQNLQKLQGNVESAVKMMFDGELRHQYVVRVWDICKMSEFKTIGFVPPPD